MAVISMVATLGGLLFGYDTAVVSGAIGFIRQHFVLDAIRMGWAASSALVGCMIGAAIAGALSDWAGRKKILMLSAFLFTVSALGAAFPRNLTELILARILGGIGIGTASVLSPLYISEISPARMRGRLVSLNQLAIVSGILLVYLVNSQIARAGDELWNMNLGWRWMFGFGSLPAVIFWALLFFVPESPRWLSKQGRNGEALSILTRVGGTAHAQSELKEIEESLLQEQGTIWELFKPGMRVALFVGVALAILSQITGINVVMYYAPEIFKSAGSKATQAIGDTVFVGIINLLLTLVAIWLVDRAGRKKLLILPTLGMGIFLAMLGGAFYFEKDPGAVGAPVCAGLCGVFRSGHGPGGVGRDLGNLSHQGPGAGHEYCHGHALDFLLHGLAIFPLHAGKTQGQCILCLRRHQCSGFHFLCVLCAGDQGQDPGGN